MIISLKQNNKLINLKIMYKKYNQLNNNLNNNKLIIKQNSYNHSKNNMKSRKLLKGEKDTYLQQLRLIISNRQIYFNQIQIINKMLQKLNKI